LLQELSDESIAVLDYRVRTRLGPTPLTSLEQPMSLSVALAPRAFVLPREGAVESAVPLSLEPAARGGYGGAARSSAPAAVVLDPAAGRITGVTAWDDRVDKSLWSAEWEAPVLVSIAAYQQAWRAARDRLEPLAGRIIDLDGVIRVDDLCARATDGALDPGPYAEREVRTTTGAVDALAALHGVAYMLGARIVPADNGGLALAPATRRCVPGPLALVARLRAESGYLPDGLRLVLLALDHPEPMAFGDLPDWAQGLLGTCSTEVGRDPNLSADTRVALGVDLFLHTTAPQLARDASAGPAGDGPVELRVLDWGGGELTRWPCPFVTPDPYDLLRGN
jgi:hypothetical protein